MFCSIYKGLLRADGCLIVVAISPFCKEVDEVWYPGRTIIKLHGH